MMMPAISTGDTNLDIISVIIVYIKSKESSRGKRLQRKNEVSNDQSKVLSLHNSISISSQRNGSNVHKSLLSFQCEKQFLPPSSSP